MPALDDYIIGPIADVYVGDYPDPGPGNTQLTWMDTPRTQGGIYKYTKPGQFEVGAADECQTDLCSVIMELTFYWSTQACSVATRNSISAGLIDDSMGSQQFAVLLLAPSADSSASIYIPQCFAKSEISNPFSKRDATVVPVVFSWFSRNKKEKIQHRGTYAELKALLGTRSPI